MQRRSFLQVIAGGISAVKSYAGVKVAQARVGSPTGWKITWSDLPSGAGCWTALPQTADRHIAFRSVTSAANDKVSARRRVIAMIDESKNGKDLLPIPSLYHVMPEGFKLTTGPTAEDIAAEAERARKADCPLVNEVQKAFGGCWHGFVVPNQIRCGTAAYHDILCAFDLLDRQPRLLNGCAIVVCDWALEPRQVWIENGDFPFDPKYNRLITVPEWNA